MKFKLSKLKSILSNLPEATRRSQGYSDEVKELCVDLARSINVREISKESGISKASIYAWVRRGNFSKSQDLPLSSKVDLPKRPLVLQEIEIPAMYHKRGDMQITIEAAGGAKVYIPADSIVLEKILDRIMGGKS